jgi:hypothetical protein
MEGATGGSGAWMAGRAHMPRGERAYQTAGEERRAPPQFPTDQAASCFLRWSANRSASATTVSVGFEHP